MNEGLHSLASKLSGVRLLLALAIALTMLTPGAAWAGFRGCRGDPIVKLSNGAKLQMSVTVAADAADVEAVTYTIHAPEGTSVDKVVYTGGALQDKETIVFVADLPADHYTVDTLVTTTSTGVAVTAVTRVGAAMASLDGLSGEHLFFTFTGTEATAASAAGTLPGD